MKIFNLILLTSFFTISCSKMDTPADKQNYAIGHQIGNNLRQQKLDYKEKAFLKGLRDGFAGEVPMFSNEDMQEGLNQLQQATLDRDQEGIDKGIELERTILEENAKKSGVTVTKSGLHFQTLKAGNGPKPKANDKVEVKVVMKALLPEGQAKVLEDGTNVVPVTGVVRGWTEALLLTQVGGKSRAVLPAYLAFGDARQGGDIPAHAVIEIEFELLQIVKK